MFPDKIVVVRGTRRRSYRGCFVPVENICVGIAFFSPVNFRFNNISDEMDLSNGTPFRQLLLFPIYFQCLFILFSARHSKIRRYSTFELREFFFISKTIIHRKTLDLYTCLQCYQRSVFEENRRTQMSIIKNLYKENCSFEHATLKVRLLDYDVLRY